MKRLLAGLLALVMVFAMLPLQALAETTPAEEPAVEETAEETAAEETVEETTTGETEAAEETTEETVEETVEETIPDTTMETVEEVFSDPAVNDVTASGSAGEAITWEWDETTGTLTISGSGEMTDFASTRNVPWYSLRREITTVILKEGITSIGSKAFWETEITAIDLPSGLTKIGEDAFASCYQLTRIEIPTGITSISSGAFSSCFALQSVIIPEGVTSIGVKAFSGCKALTEVVIPDGVTSIERSAFERCTALEQITIPDSVATIGDAAFKDCTALTQVTMGSPSLGTDVFSGTPYLASQATEEGFVVLNGTLVEYRGTATEIVIPENVVDIGNSAFYQNQDITSVVIPEGVTSIGDFAFYYCSALKSVTIPGTLTFLGANAFYGCSALESVTIPAGITKIYEYTFAYCKGLKELTLPEGLIEIGAYAFWGCESLAELTLPQTLEKIGNSAFFSCSGLTELVLPNSLTSLGSNVFHSCSGLKSIHIGAGIATISTSAFADCTGLLAVTIPVTVTFINQSAFRGCTNLGSIEFEDVSPLARGGFAEGLYISWAAFADCMALTNAYLPDRLQSIESNTFQGCLNLEGIWASTTQVMDGETGPRYQSDSRGVLYEYTYDSEKKEFIAYLIVSAPAKLSGHYDVISTVTSIGADFYGCSRLTSLTFPGGAPQSVQAFFGCTSLESITVGPNEQGFYTDGETGALLQNSGSRVDLYFIPASTKEYTIPAEVGFISYGILNNAALTNIYVEEGNTAFQSIDGVLYTADGTELRAYPTGRTDTVYVIPDTAEEFGENSFAFCKYLKEVWVTGETYGLGDDTFYGTKMTVYYPEEVGIWEMYIMELEYSPIANITLIPYTGTPGGARKGDLTGDGSVDSLDAVTLLWYAAFPEDYTIDQSKADFTGDGQVNVDDAVYLVWHTLFPQIYPL